MVTLAVAGVLISYALPRFDAVVGRSRSAAALNQIIGSVQLARNVAVTHRIAATLCGSADGESCLDANQWHRGAMVFLDRNRNGERDAGDTLIKRLPAHADGTRIYWRSFRRRSYLIFTPRGFTHWQNGHFLYCPAEDDPTLIRQVVLNAAGRVRNSTDSDGDGVYEDTRGRPLTCP